MPYRFANATPRCPKRLAEVIDARATRSAGDWLFETALEFKQALGRSVRKAHLHGFPGIIK